MAIILWLVLGFLLFKIIYVLFLEKHQNSFSIYFGLPGSGKTTFAAYLSKKRLKKEEKVYSNVAIKNTYKIDPIEDVGVYDISDGLLVIDEAGLEYNNRSFKSFPKTALKFFKFHRHYNVDVVMFSQDLDMDVKLRKLANKIYLVQKSFIPYFVVRRRINRKVGIDPLTKQIIDEYSFAFFGRKWIFSPKLWKLFNSVEHEELPYKEYEVW